MRAYAILGVTRTESYEAVKAAWVALCKEHHPDLGGEPGVLSDINAAWNILRDEVRRREYNQAQDDLLRICNDCGGKGGRVARQGFTGVGKITACTVCEGEGYNVKQARR
jgi:DnaJ-class molecular chaperone